jgi:hypothetical protein
VVALPLLVCLQLWLIWPLAVWGPMVMMMYAISYKLLQSVGKNIGQSNVSQV